MIKEQNSQENDGIRNVSTKVPAWVAELLNIICKSRGTDIYSLMQLVLQFIIETAKVSGPVPPQMKALLHMMKMDADWDRAFRFANPAGEMDVAQVILVLQQHDAKGARQGFGLVMIDKPYLTDTEPTMTTCVDDIFERITEVSMKGLYKELTELKKRFDVDTVREVLTTMCDAQLIETLNEMDRQELPQVGDFHDIGKRVIYANKCKRKLKYTVDTLPIQFTDYDKQTAEAEVKDWEGSHRETEPSAPVDDISEALGFKPYAIEP